MKNIKNEKFRYLLPPAITLLIYSIILAVKGIYPFGNNTIDYYDMAQQIAAFYYHVYDALHGTKGFFYDWYTALGVNMAMSTSGCSNISPFNLFFLFIRRESLLRSLSVFNGLKLMCMSAAMYFYLDKTHAKSPAFFKITASVGYSFCGFVLVLYITNQWIDIAVMFPLIMYFYDKMLKTGRMRGYVITLMITLVASYYLGFMILIFIFLYTGLELTKEKLSGHKEAVDKTITAKDVADKDITDKDETDKNTTDGAIADKDITSKDISTEDINDEEKKHGLHIIELGIGTILSLALSSFILIPQLSQMLSSARFKNGNGSESTGLIGKYLEILSHVKGDYTTRWWSLLGISFMAAVIVTGMIGSLKKRRFKTVITSLTLILIMILELFFESINLIWHFGSYVQYPIRNGFIIYFVFAYLSCYFAGEMYGDDGSERTGIKKEADNKEETGRPYLGFIFTAAGFLVFIALYRNRPGLHLNKVFYMTSAIMAASFISYMILLGRAAYKWAAGILAFEVLCYGFLLFGKPDFITGYAEEPEQNGEYIYICDQLRDKFKLEPEFLYRVKNPDESLNANYGLVLMQPALSNWTHMIAPGEQSGALRWGYSIQFTRLLDAGGTVFSDALLGIRNVISSVPMDERLYEAVDSAVITVNHLSGETAEYTLYKPRYTLPFGVVLSGTSDLFDKTDEEMKDRDTVGLHNTIYHAIQETGSEDEDLAYWIIRNNSVKDKGTSLDETRTSESSIVEIETAVDKESAIYLLCRGGDHEYENCVIEILDASEEDKTGYVRVPTLGDADNIHYPAHFNNNGLYLGSFKDETVRIRITEDLNKGEALDFSLMGISLDAMDKLCAAYPDGIDDRIRAGRSTLEFTVDVDEESEDAMMLLPLTFDEGWKIMRNGKNIKASACAGLFTAIALEGGENSVIMKFTPKGTLPGIIISIAALMICVLYIILTGVKILPSKQKQEEAAERISALLCPIYLAAFAIVILFMYIVPVIYGIFALVT